MFSAPRAARRRVRRIALTFPPFGGRPNFPERAVTPVNARTCATPSLAA